MNEGMMQAQRCAVGKQKTRYPDDVRRVALTIIRQGESISGAARRLNVPPSTVSGWATRHGVASPVSSAYPTIATKRRALALVREGRVLEQVARALELSPQTLGRWAREEGIEVNHARSQQMRRNHASNPEGRRHQHRIREAVRMQVVDGVGTHRIARALGVNQTTSRTLLKTPYAEALRSYVYNVVDNPRKRGAIARDMREAGYDEACIRRTLYGGDEEVGDE